MNDNLLTIPCTTIKGEQKTLADYAGKAILVVNTASKCGFTPHYAGLQELHERYHERGLVVCGFPCNDFGGQEPGTEDEVKKFCTLNYDVTFPMFAKVHVRGKEMHPLFHLLVEHPRHGGTQAVVEFHEGAFEDVEAQHLVEPH